MVKCLIETMIFLEFTDEELLNPDVAVEMQERIASELNDLNHNEKNILKNKIKEIVESYKDEKIKNYITSLPDNLGI